ncbi:hypothetical protein Nepgr_006167 [Nepenthes gracilis]|uniref:Uncharacterized protein n=1 Tax=Nepenthes gracilis TaxID=150966 RepID=A0AAD3S4L3_NEPGR|nr:hypothetical protein Nepgr_006167 [Nepenthes gracilis]
MEIISRPFNGRNYWKKRGYKLLDGATTRKRSVRVVKIKSSDRPSTVAGFFWRIRRSPKLRLKMICSPKTLWSKFRDGYINMMLRMAGDRYSNGGSEFQGKISKARHVPVKLSSEGFERRLVLEIYKSLSTSRGLSEI